MAYKYDRFEREDGGGSFLMGLLAGTVLGAGLGMLFAPKTGSELRNQLGEQAGKLRTQATDGYQQATEKVSQIVDRGREAYDRARSGSGWAATRASTNSRSSTPGSPVGLDVRRWHRQLYKQPRLKARGGPRCDVRTSHRRSRCPASRTNTTPMTQSSAEKIANVVHRRRGRWGRSTTSLKTPALRRLAWRLTVVAITGTLPAWVRQEIRAGWEASPDA